MWPPVNALFGPYRVLAPLGAGGMGEVYRALDTRLGRQVALKVLPPAFAEDPERLGRFEQEARLVAALEHPNILAIHDLGREAGVPYLVTELLEGQTLRDLLKEGPLPPRKVLDLGRQAASGLGAAHEKGIVHRDLKPENLFLTRDGRLKILDFGLARPAKVPDATGPQRPDSPIRTATGVILGSVAYLSPEQARGHAPDHRSDLFSLGVVLYELLTGERPFQGESVVDTLNAIVRDDPPELRASRGPMPPALDRVVRHCLEKEPGLRVQSARDLAFELETLSLGDAVLPLRLHFRWTRRQALRALALGGAAAALLALGAWWSPRGRELPSPRFRQMSFRPGAVTAARFGADGSTVVYAMQEPGGASHLFTGRAGSPDFRPLGVDGASLLALSGRDELALAVKGRAESPVAGAVLARVPLAGGAPRELESGVSSADWQPGGEGLALVRRADGGTRIEFPSGQVRAATDGWFSHLRFSPDGKRLAYLHHPLKLDDRGFVEVLELATGKRQRLGREWSTAQGLAWAPDGAVWFSGAEDGVSRDLWRVDLSGRERRLLSVPGGATLLDVARDGRALLSHDQNRLRLLAQSGDTPPRDLSWFNWSFVHGLSADGSLVLFDEEANSAGPEYDLYLRPLDGRPAMHLGTGMMPALAPDGRQVAAFRLQPQPALMLVPTGPGSERRFPLPLKALLDLAWLPDGRGLLVVGAAEGQTPGLFRVDAAEGRLDPLLKLPPTVRFGLLPSPDGRRLLMRLGPGPAVLLDLAHPEAAPQPAPGLDAKDFAVAWEGDGALLLAVAPEEHTQGPNRLMKLDLATGTRSLLRNLPLELQSQALAGLRVGPNGTPVVYSTLEARSDLFLAEGLR